MAPLAEAAAALVTRGAATSNRRRAIVSHVQLSFANILQHIHSIAAVCTAAAAASYIVLVKRKHKVTKVTQV